MKKPTPKPYCTACHGSGRTRNSQGHEQNCRTCHGTGKPVKLTSDAEPALLLEWLNKKIDNLKSEISYRRHVATGYRAAGERLRLLDVELCIEADRVQLEQLNTLLEQWWL